jgi:hypothetical protein
MKKNMLLLTLILGVILVESCNTNSSSDVSPNVGTGGSTARFTISKDYLYVVDNQSLRVFNVQAEQNPSYIKKVGINTNAETIFPFGNNLLIGTQTGMYIFKITTPEAPTLLSIYQHVRSCDPVVADSTFAYVTLRSGTFCNGANNTLDIVDISDWTKPTIVKSYQMKHPHGLAVDGKLLFLGEDDFGLKVFDKSNLLNIKELASFPDVKAADVIAKDKVLLVTAQDGIYQYSYENPKDIKLLSKIAITP